MRECLALVRTALCPFHVMQMILDAKAGMLVANAAPMIATPNEAGPRHLAFRPNGRCPDLLNQTGATMSTLRIEAGAGILAEARRWQRCPRLSWDCG